MDVRLSTPRLRVIRASDETPFEVQTINPDLVLWDRTRAKHKWPKIDDAPFLWLTFIAWAAARRSRVIGPEITYEAFEADTLAVEALEDDDDETGLPTLPGPGPG
jgi:hypothetical protein